MDIAYTKSGKAEDIAQVLNRFNRTINSIKGTTGDNVIIVPRTNIPADEYIKNINYKKKKFVIDAERFEDEGFLRGYFLSNPCELKRGDWVRYAVSTKVNGEKRTRYLLGGYVNWVDGMLDETKYKVNAEKMKTDVDYRQKVKGYWTETTCYENPEFMRLGSIGNPNIKPWRVNLNKPGEVVTIWRCPKINEGKRRDFVEAANFYNKAIADEGNVVGTLVNRKIEKIKIELDKKYTNSFI